MSAVEAGRIKLSMRNLNCSTKDKSNHMLAYQMEFGYGLALSPGDVVSVNPGFEAVLGIVNSWGVMSAKGLVKNSALFGVFLKNSAFFLFLRILN